MPVGARPDPDDGHQHDVAGLRLHRSARVRLGVHRASTAAFTLTNVPSGAAVTVVVQLGKWQRVFTRVGHQLRGEHRSNSPYGSHLTLPSTHLQGNIPLFAVDTGGVDSMECVLRKMGIATSEFVDPAIVGGVPTAAGRVHFYEGSIVAGGAIIDANTPTETR